jgi:hypothetical protein
VPEIARPEDLARLAEKRGRYQDSPALADDLGGNPDELLEPEVFADYYGAKPGERDPRGRFKDKAGITLDAAQEWVKGGKFGAVMWHGTSHEGAAGIRNTGPRLATPGGHSPTNARLRGLWLTNDPNEARLYSGPKRGPNLQVAVRLDKPLVVEMGKGDLLGQIRAQGWKGESWEGWRTKAQQQGFDGIVEKSSAGYEVVIVLDESKARPVVPEEETRIAATPNRRMHPTFDSAAAAWGADHFAEFESSVGMMNAVATRQVGMYEGEFEPSYTITVPAQKAEGMRERLREDWQQDEVATFTYDDDGPDLEVSVVGIDPDDFAKRLREWGILGATFPSRRSATLWLKDGRDDRAFEQLVAYTSSDNGPTISVQPGKATGIG